MYVSSYQESDRSPDPAPQVANMAIETWPGTNEPVELFLNAGPGRIPSNHSALLDLCQAVNVRLEPYIFLSGSNLLSSPTFKDGQPVPWRQINFSLMGELAEVMTAAVQDGYILQGYEEASVYNMLSSSVICRPTAPSTALRRWATCASPAAGNPTLRSRVR